MREIKKYNTQKYEDRHPEIPMKFRVTTIPCFNCGEPVRVTLDKHGFYVGCVFCERCSKGGHYSAGTEQMIPREY